MCPIIMALTVCAGVWSCCATTGDRPPPCSGFTFTAVDDRRGVLFGGKNEMGRMNSVYNIDLLTMVKYSSLYNELPFTSEYTIILQTWSKLSQSGGGSWPEERSGHAACCLNYGQQYPQLLVTGGRNREDKPLSDAWVLDVERRQWRKA